MRFSLKIFISFFITTLLLGSLLIWVGFRHVRRQTNEEFVSRYQVFSKVMGDTLTRLDTSTEALMLNAVKVVAANDLREGVLSTELLKDLRDELSVTHIFVVDRRGNFIRSTNEDPKLIPNAYSFCPAYREMISGTSNIAATPIIHPNPEPKPYKFLFIPNHNRQRLLEVGIRVDFVAKTLSEALGSDQNIVSMSLYSPKGDPFGRFSSKGVEFKGELVHLPEKFPALVDSGDKLRFFAKVASSHPQCCQCDISGTSNSGEYYYVLEAEVSKKELATLQAKTRNIFIGLAIGNLLLALFIGRFLSRRLVRNIEVAVDKVRSVTKSGNLAHRLNLGGKDEVAFLTKEFDRLLDSVESSQKKIIEAEKLQTKVQLAKEIAHNINSPAITIEMMIPMMGKLPEWVHKSLRNSVKEIKTLAERLSRQADSQSDTADSVPLAKEIVRLRGLVEDVIAEKQIEFSHSPSTPVIASYGKDVADVAALIDSVELRAILSNIINNAAESYPNRAGLVKVSLSTNQDQSVIEISDQGSGIPSEILMSLGAKAVTFGKKNGKGLGLLHAYKVISAWGGEIKIESGPNEGTKVTIILRKVMSLLGRTKPDEQEARV